MKIKYINDDKYIIFACKEYYKFDKNTIDKFINKMLKRINRTYDIDICYKFDIKCYISNYGIILILNRNKDPFYKYINKTFNIKYYDNFPFLFEIDDYFIKDKVKCNIYIYNKKYYMDVKEDIINVIEHINDIVYTDEVLNIIGNKV